MDFSVFDSAQNIPTLTWLGRKDWVQFKDLPQQRAISCRPRPLFFKKPERKNRPRPQPNLKDFMNGQDPFMTLRNMEVPEQKPEEGSLIVGPEEYGRHSSEHWQKVRKIRDVLEHDVLSTLWYLTLSKALAGGPKIFRPTPDQCEALENTAATFPFEMYKQPFPVIVLEIPQKYREHLVREHKVSNGPTHVLVYHDEKNNFITLSAFYNQNNIITHVTPNREEYETIEDSIVKNRERRLANGMPLTPEDEAEFNVAEIVQRLGMNFAMMMTMLGTRIEGPLDPSRYSQLEEESKRKHKGQPSKKAQKALQKLPAQMMIVKFEQEIDFYDELEENVEVADAAEIEQLRKAPKTHWRRGHWRQQPYGPGNKLRKAKYIKPLLVRAKYFVGDLKDATVTYTAHPGRKDNGGGTQTE